MRLFLLLKKNNFVVGLIFLSFHLFAHPMPHSVLRLDVTEGRIFAALKIPLKEMQYAVDFDVTTMPDRLLARHRAEIEAYLLAHLHPKTSDGRNWVVTIQKMKVETAQQEATGNYTELAVTMDWHPPTGGNTRQFSLDCDVIVHQLVTHKIFVTVRNDFAQGRINEKEREIGLICMNNLENKVLPLPINMEGSRWKGFTAMIGLGINHIIEGTDHLLFLFVLLLPAPFLAEKKRWTRFGGTRYSVIRLFKIITSFTIGHSISLLLGAKEWLILPSQPVEISIALTIFITAIHAIRPLFYGKETAIAICFGLIHGLAFATILAELRLEGSEMAISILGFNIGIELMQLFVVICTVPWLILLSRSAAYPWFRVVGACFAIVASVAWFVARVTSHNNWVSLRIESVLAEGKWFVLGLACLAAISWLFDSRNKEDRAL